MEPVIFMAALGTGAGTGAAAGGATPDMLSGLIIPALLILALFYFMFVMPQRRQQKQHEELVKSLKKGDEVVTTGGMFGTVVGFNERENTVYLKIGENSKIEIQRHAIAGLRKTSVPDQTAGLKK